jgi:hypothetical protein
MQSCKIYKGANSNLIDCNAIMQIYKGANSNLIDCNANHAKYAREVTPI